ILVRDFEDQLTKICSPVPPIPYPNLRPASPVSPSDTNSRHWTSRLLFYASKHGRGQPPLPKGNLPRNVHCANPLYRRTKETGGRQTILSVERYLLKRL